MQSKADQSTLIIRDGEVGDFDAIQAIYEEQVLHGTASFEEIPPTVTELLTRFEATTQLGFPFLVASINQTIVGYAYAGRYRSRSAYRHTAENSVYVHQAHRAKGVGKALLLATIARCEAMGLREMIGIIGDSENTGSIALHAACGFELVGTLRRVGYKHGRWLDTVVMQRTLSPSCEDILPPLEVL